ncbi:MAG TPA: DUF2752 domain-containing protein [Dysgonamonadaceae bacterium]|nr:DUF2752 domain-containing protein [Dysgonamonadaceae bacterium]
MKYKKKVLIAVAAILVATVLIIFFYIDPDIYPFFPKCPFLVITGLECPGCGSQRSFHHLLHFNIAGAFLQNPLVVIFGPYILLGLYIEYLEGKKKFPKIRNYLFGKYAAIIILVVIIGFWIGRNII